MKRIFTIPIILSLSMGHCALNAMEETGATASQEPPRTIFNLNIKASLVNKQNEILGKRALNCTAYANDTVTEHSNRLVPFITDLSSASQKEAATQYGTEIKMLPVFDNFRGTIVTLQCAITKTLNGKTEILQPNQRIKFIVTGVRIAEHKERINCDEELTLQITAHRTLSALEKTALIRGVPIDFFD